MEPHPELYWWKKCPTCGFSAILKEELSPKDWEHADRNPLMLYPDKAAIQLIEAAQKLKYKKT
jgi:hypothetical protein